jgi:hypothetical protein
MERLAAEVSQAHRDGRADAQTVRHRRADSQTQTDGRTELDVQTERTAPRQKTETETETPTKAYREDASDTDICWEMERAVSRRRASSC